MDQFKLALHTVVSASQDHQATASHWMHDVRPTLQIDFTDDVIYHLWKTVKLVSWLEFNVPFQHKYGYIRDENG